MTIDLAVHIISGLVYLFGEPVKISGKIKSIYSTEVEYFVIAHFTFPSGFSCDLEASWSEPKYRKSTTMIEIIGEKASLELFNYNYKIFYTSGITEEYLYPDIYKGEFLNIGGTSFSRQAVSVANFFNDSEFSSYNLDCAVITQRIVDRIYESSSENAEYEI